MNSNRKKHWANVYLKNSPFDVSWYQDKPEISLELIRSTQINNVEAIIDVGGGASFLVDNLCQEGYTNLSVLDISGIALSVAKDRLGKLSKNIKWFEEDITQFNSSQQYTLWHDRAVFHFLTDPLDRKSYLQKLKKYLRPNGHLIIATFAVDGPEKCSGLEIVQYDSEKIKNELGGGFVLVNEIKELHITPTEKVQKFMYFHFVRMNRK